MPIQQRSQLKGFGQSTNEKYIVEDIRDIITEVNIPDVKSGVHTLVYPSSGLVTGPGISSDTNGSAPTLANRLTACPYNPAYTFTCSNLFIDVAGTLVPSSLARICIYSDVNGIPTTKLYESADLDCSTAGKKIAITSFTFEAGNWYWLVIHTSANSSFISFPASGLIPIRYDNSGPVCGYISNGVPFGTPSPNTFPNFLFSSSNVMGVFITVA